MQALASRNPDLQGRSLTLQGCLRRSCAVCLNALCPNWNSNRTRCWKSWNKTVKSWCGSRHWNKNAQRLRKKSGRLPRISRKRRCRWQGRRQHVGIWQMRLTTCKNSWARRQRRRLSRIFRHCLTGKRRWKRHSRKQRSSTRNTGPARGIWKRQSIP